MKTLFILANLIVVLFIATPNKVEAQKSKATIPTEITVDTYLRNRVTSQSGGALLVSSFSKTNGYAQGYGIYVIEWQALILVQQECWKSGDMFAGYWQNFQVFLRQPSGIDAVVVGVGTAKHLQKGQSVRLGGNAFMRKTEQGWRLENFEVKTASVLAASTGSVVTQGASKLYVAPNGEFSYSPPNGSTLRDQNGSKFKAAFLPMSDGVYPVIMVEEESFFGTLDDYVATKLPSLISEFKSATNLRMISRSEFITDNNARGIKAVLQFEMPEKTRIATYFFDGKNGKAIYLGCMSPQGNAYDIQFDKSMKTFKAPASQKP